MNKPYRFEIYPSYRNDGKRKRREWRWRLVSPNGRIVATDGGQGYARRKDCADMIDKISIAAPSASVVEEALAANGWQALVIWECETKDREKLEQTIRTFLS